MPDMDMPPMDDPTGMPPMEDPNAMPPMDDPNDMSPVDDGEENNEVDNKAEQAAGTLSDILSDANEATVDYVMKMVTKAAGKNQNIGDNNIEEYINNLKGEDLEDDENMDETGEELMPEEQPAPEEQQPPMQESRKRIDYLIDEALNYVLGKGEIERPDTKLRKPKSDNPFVSPYN